MTHPAVGEWWYPGRWRGRDAEGKDSYSGCDGDPECDTCHERSLDEALESRSTHALWWEREQNTYRGRMLRGWANLLASRYGRPVYLTGGALKDASPRDLDVRVVLSATEFRDRFGKYERRDGNGYCFRLEAMDDERRWHLEVAKMNKQGANNTHLPIDFQIQPILEAVGFINEQRVRLDDLPDLKPPWED